MAVEFIPGEAVDDEGGDELFQIAGYSISLMDLPIILAILLVCIIVICVLIFICRKMSSDDEEIEDDFDNPAVIDAPDAGGGREVELAGGNFHQRQSNHQDLPTKTSAPGSTQTLASSRRPDSSKKFKEDRWRDADVAFTDDDELEYVDHKLATRAGDPSPDTLNAGRLSSTSTTNLASKSSASNTAHAST